MSANRDSALVAICGRLVPDGAERYQRYLAGTAPLLQRYGAGVLAVGSGLAHPRCAEAWPISAALHFPSMDACAGFFDDPDYQALIPIRDAAYDRVNLAAFEVESWEAPHPGELICVHQTAAASCFAPAPGGRRLAVGRFAPFKHFPGAYAALRILAYDAELEPEAVALPEPDPGDRLFLFRARAPRSETRQPEGGLP